MTNPRKLNNRSKNFLNSIAESIMSNLIYSGISSYNDLTKIVNYNRRYYEPHFYGIVNDNGKVIGSVYSASDDPWRIKYDYAKEYKPEGYRIPNDFAFDGDYRTTRLQGPIPFKDMLQISNEELPSILLNHPEILKKQGEEFIKRHDGKEFMQGSVDEVKKNLDKWTTKKEDIELDPMMYTDDSNLPWIRDAARKLINGED